VIARVQIEVGQRFGMLRVEGPAPAMNQKTRVVVRFDCGSELIVRTNSLRTGNTRSCGCEHPGGRTHGHTVGGATRTYRIWTNMRARCAGQISPENYADLGVTCCERWLSFENFLTDMGEAPDDRSLDRYPDPAGNYEPSNCRWATAKEQRANQRIKQ